MPPFAIKLSGEPFLEPVLVFAMIAVAVPCHSLWGIRQPSQLKWTWRGVPANILIHETPMDQVRREDNQQVVNDESPLISLNL